MKAFRKKRSSQNNKQQLRQRNRRSRGRQGKPVAAYRQRPVNGKDCSETFNAPELWHEPVESGDVCFVEQNPGEGYVHPVTVDEVQDRLRQIPERFTQHLEVIQFSRMTRKRALFPCYGMQWGPTVYLYPIEESLTETYVRAPRPEQIIEARMFGGKWTQQGRVWQLTWTPETIKDFYLNNVLIHEVGHIGDFRNSSFNDRERYANWFAIEYGFRASRGRR